MSLEKQRSGFGDRPGSVVANETSSGAVICLCVATAMTHLIADEIACTGGEERASKKG